ncbi:DUF1129 family protein [Planococcus maitriensis]|uniref:NADH dehydrogenase subunit n=1 Tax=Planococcus maitriensis TaxID=221799 RepID=A0A365K4T5_9BACL|nr:DUF1129 family protein [Planococcus maitriensis]RAZ67668.1 NADH dehydrogenase subunit [Planococcus maitriensis]
MLSAKSEQFLIELRMYLMQRGKSDEDINEVVDELESHLIESEKRGKNVESIVGKDPKQYMKSIGEPLPIAAKELMVLIPSTILVILAYLAYVPALSGDFRLSQTVLWGVIPVVLSLLIYSSLIFKVFPKFHDKPVKLGLIAVAVSTLVLGFWVAFYLWMVPETTSAYFTATAEQNYMILAVCLVVFIAYALYTKSWITIIVAALMSAGPLAEKWIPQDVNEDPVYIAMAIGIFVLIGISVIWLLMRKRRKTA